MWFLLQLPETLKNTHSFSPFDRFENRRLRLDEIQQPTWSSYDDVLPTAPPVPPANPRPHLRTLRLSTKEKLYLETRMVGRQIARLDSDLRRQLPSRRDDERANIGVCISSLDRKLLFRPSEPRIFERLRDMVLDRVHPGLDGGDKKSHGFSCAGFGFDEQVALGCGWQCEFWEERENLGLDDGHVGVLERLDGDGFECMGVYCITQSVKMN